MFSTTDPQITARLDVAISPQSLAAIFITAVLIFITILALQRLAAHL